jgi:hypothetical protein
MRMKRTMHPTVGLLRLDYTNLWLDQRVGTHDDVPANPVAYKASASAGSFSTQTGGTVTSGAGSFSFSFRKAKRTHLLQIEIELTDPIGNQARIARNVRLR